jgi:hypothetical protein
MSVANATRSNTDSLSRGSFAYLLALDVEFASLAETVQHRSRHYQNAVRARVEADVIARETGSRKGVAETFPD